jgi:hypothetical protein
MAGLAIGALLWLFCGLLVFGPQWAWGLPLCRYRVTMRCYGG